MDLSYILKTYRHMDLASEVHDLPLIKKSLHIKK